jgi:mono/diheme cytochrome c family protein
MWLALPGCADADGDLPAAYRRLQVPEAVLASAAARERGRQLFLANCALCHGERGDGNGPRREGLTGHPRNFTDGRWHETASPRRVFHAIRQGRSGTSMPSWPTLSDEEAWQVTAFVLALGERR